MVSVVVSVTVVIVLTALTDWKPASCLLGGWDIGVAIYLLLTLRMMAGSDVHSLRRHAALQDEGRFAVLVLTVTAALVSVAAIFVILADTTAPAQWRFLHLALALLTIMLSWAFIHTIFALHYAHEFYDHRSEEPGGILFPGGGDPDYWDFMYFSFVIGMTSQVSDVGIASRRIRRTVAAHGVVSFVFNTALLALTVNIGASGLLAPAR